MAQWNRMIPFRGDRVFAHSAKMRLLSLSWRLIGEGSFQPGDANPLSDSTRAAVEGLGWRRASPSSSCLP